MSLTITFIIYLTSHRVLWQKNEMIFVPALAIRRILEELLKSVIVRVSSEVHPEISSTFYVLQQVFLQGFVEAFQDILPWEPLENFTRDSRDWLQNCARDYLRTFFRNCIGNFPSNFIVIFFQRLFEKFFLYILRNLP